MAKQLVVSDAARARAVFNHDVFNIIMMTVVVLMSAHLLSEHMVIANIATRNSIMPTGREYGRVLLMIFTAYMAFDSLWIIVQPTIVSAKNPLLILFHHAVTAGMMSTVFIDEHYMFYLPACLLCESNTVFLALRRNTKRGMLANTISEYLFIITWFIFRLLSFPAILVLAFYEWYFLYERHGTYFNLALVGIVTMGIMTVLSLHWTREMVSKNLFTKESGKE